MNYQNWLLSEVGRKTVNQDTRHLTKEDLGFSRVIDHPMLEEYVDFHLGSTPPVLEGFEVEGKLYPYFKDYPEIAVTHYYLKHYDRAPFRVYTWKSWDQLESTYELLNGLTPAGVYKALNELLPITNHKVKEASDALDWKDFLDMKEARTDKLFQLFRDTGSGLYQEMTQRVYTYFEQVEKLNEKTWKESKTPQISRAPVTKVPRIYGHTGVSKSALIEVIPTKISITVDLQYYGCNQEMVLQLPPRVTVVKTGQFDPTDFAGMSSDMPLALFKLIMGQDYKGVASTVERINISNNMYVIAPVRELWENSDQAVVQSRLILAEWINKNYIAVDPTRTWNTDKTYNTPFTYIGLTDEGRAQGITQATLELLVYYARPTIFFLDEFSRSEPKAMPLWMTVLSDRSLGSLTYRRTFFVLADNEVPRNMDEALREFYTQMYHVSGANAGLYDPATNDRFDQIYVDETNRSLQMEVVDYLANKYSDIPEVETFLLAVQDAGYLYALPRPRTYLIDPDKRKKNDSIEDVSQLEEKYPTFRGWDFLLSYLREVFRNNEPVSIQVVESILGSLNRKPFEHLTLTGNKADVEKAKNIRISDISSIEKFSKLDSLQELIELYFRGGAYQSTIYGGDSRLTFSPKSIRLVDDTTESSYADRLEKIVRSGIPVLLLGRPGVAKTAITETLAKKLNRDAKDSNKVSIEMIRHVLNLETEERGMVRGSPALTEIWSTISEVTTKTLQDIRERYKLPLVLPTLSSGRPESNFLNKIERLRRDPNAYLVVVFDELNRTTEIKQAIVLDAISNHKLYGVDFSDVADRVAIVATSNYYRGTTYEDLSEDTSASIYHGVASLDHAVMARYAVLFIDEITEQDLDGFIDYWSRKLVTEYGPQTHKAENELISELKALFNNYRTELLAYFNADLKAFREFQEETGQYDMQFLSPRGFSSILEKVLNVYLYRVVNQGDDVDKVKLSSLNIDVSESADFENFLKLLQVIAISRDARFNRAYTSFFVGRKTLDDIIPTFLPEDVKDKNNRQNWYNIPPQYRISYVADTLLKAYSKENIKEKDKAKLEETIRDYVYTILSLDGSTGSLPNSLENQLQDTVNSSINQIYQYRNKKIFGVHKDFLKSLVLGVYKIFSNAYQEYVLKSLKFIEKEEKLSDISLLEWSIINPVLVSVLAPYLPKAEKSHAYTPAPDYPAILELIIELAWLVKGKSLEEVLKDPAALQDILDNILKLSATYDLKLPTAADFTKPQSLSAKISWSRNRNEKSGAILNNLLNKQSQDYIVSGLSELQATLWTLMFRMWSQGILAEQYVLEHRVFDDLLSSYDVVFAPIFPGGVYVNDAAWYKLVQKPSVYTYTKAGIQRTAGDKKKEEMTFPYMPMSQYSVLGHDITAPLVTPASKLYYRSSLRIAIARTYKSSHQSDSFVLDVFEFPVEVKDFQLDFKCETESDKSSQRQVFNLKIDFDTGDTLSTTSELYLRGYPDLIKAEYRSVKDEDSVYTLVLPLAAPFYKDQFSEQATADFIKFKSSKSTSKNSLIRVAAEYTKLLNKNNKLLSGLFKDTQIQDSDAAKLSTVLDKKPGMTVADVVELPDPVRVLRRAFDLLDK